MCGYFCIGFIDFMLKGKSLFDYANLFSPNDYENNDKIIKKILIYIKKVGMRKIYCTKCKKYKEFKKLKASYKTLLLSNICNKCRSEAKQIFKEKESIEIFKILGLITNIEEYTTNI